MTVCCSAETKAAARRPVAARRSFLNMMIKRLIERYWDFVEPTLL